MRSRTVLDYGYVDLVETWGSDERIIEAARMSTDKGFQEWGDETQCAYCGLTVAEANEVVDVEHKFCPANDMNHSFTAKGPAGDEKLLRYLYEHKHSTPFEFAGMVIEVQAPIFVFREWHRHRTQSYNEMSARYVPLPDMNYVPSVERLMVKSGTNKQASSAGRELTLLEARLFQEGLCREYKAQQELYTLSLEVGVPKEPARLIVPVGRYSRMRASANLRNWLGFLTLRMDTHAQWEIRQYANVVGELIAMSFPRTWELFMEGQQ